MSDAKVPTSPAVKMLQPLIGDWTMRITWSETTHRLVGGPQTIETPSHFEWVLGGDFVLQTVGSNGGASARWMIGRDETSGAFSALYADDRGVSRIYEMSFSGGLWKIWRAASGFHQRFEGRFSSDGKKIAGKWEKSEDGVAWEKDFGLTYVRAGQRLTCCLHEAARCGGNLFV